MSEETEASHRRKDVQTQRPHGAFLGTSLLFFLKPRFKRALGPVATALACKGVTANQVTMISLIGSLAVGASLLIWGANSPRLYILLPMWLVLRMAFATIDGTLAHDFGQKSRLGGILNELGDILSDIALYAPLSLVAPFTPQGVALIIALAVGTEVAGLAGEWLGAGRRVEGPMGKADRSLVFGAIAAWLSVCGALPGAADLLIPLLVVLLLLTVVNRLRFAWAEIKARRR